MDNKFRSTFSYIPERVDYIVNKCEEVWGQMARPSGTQAAVDVRHGIIDVTRISADLTRKAPVVLVMALWISRCTVAHMYEDHADAMLLNCSSCFAESICISGCTVLAL